ncbi:unnamed protein product [Chondrus crispus]|uniref:Uncharacterized protein n=1 Tax=Chondrus crispus TaxID=2769 RepID=R7QMA8_CHOCR|nr:unnamed protein product [Chondrus crispus]CDF39642.1 unnamed protein product [Chondrus crispus]|eukprot:XP_005709936.1 unnamed protein product [Chondrus crispus]
MSFPSVVLCPERGPSLYSIPAAVQRMHRMGYTVHIVVRGAVALEDSFCRSACQGLRQEESRSRTQLASQGAIVSLHTRRLFTVSVPETRLENKVTEPWVRLGMISV